MKSTIRNFGTRLQPGMRFKLGDEEYTVVLVNDCRAYCEPTHKTRTVTIENKVGEDGKPLTFQARKSGISISPNSEVEIL